MKKPLLAATSIAIGAVLLLLSTGCHSIDPKLITAMAGDNAHIRARVTSLYGTIEFERVMDFPPPPPPAPTVAPAESQEAPAPAPKPRRLKPKPAADAPTP